MTDPTPDRPRWTRVSNPVTPTVHTFSDKPSAPRSRWTRVSNPVTPTIHTFGPVPVLTLTLTRHPESDNRSLADVAVGLIWAIDRLDKEFGGNGYVFDKDDSREEPNGLRLRLIPRLVDDGAAKRHDQLVQALVEAKREAAESHLRDEDAEHLRNVKPLERIEGQVKRSRIPGIELVGSINGMAH